jgi:hypothetical protein
MIHQRPSTIRSFRVDTYLIVRCSPPPLRESVDSSGEDEHKSRRDLKETQVMCSGIFVPLSSTIAQEYRLVATPSKQPAHHEQNNSENQTSRKEMDNGIW